MKRKEALNLIKSLLEQKGCSNITLFNEITEPDVHKAINVPSPHFVRLEIESEDFQELSDSHYIEEMFILAERAFTRKGLKWCDSKLGVAVVASTENLYEDLAKLYPSIPSSQYEVLFILLE